MSLQVSKDFVLLLDLWVIRLDPLGTVSLAGPWRR